MTDGGWPPLLERRIVLACGSLDDAAANRVAAELMTLDATGDEPIDLRVDCAGGSLEAALALADTIDLLGVPVRATCVARAEGPAALMVAVAPLRFALAHARFCLAAPDAAFTGPVGAITRWLDEQRVLRHDLVARLAAATGRAFEHVEADVEAGRRLGAEEARRYGLVDVIGRPGPRLRARGVQPRFGFVPPG